MKSVISCLCAGSVVGVVLLSAADRAAAEEKLQSGPGIGTRLSYVLNVKLASGRKVVVHRAL